MLSADVVSIGVVAPSAELRAVELPSETGLGAVPAYCCEEKVGAGVIAPARLRRLGRTQKLLLTASKRALAELEKMAASLEEAAVCVGSGAGESDETVKFLRNMVEHQGDQPMPSRFVNSVPSSLSTQIGIEFGMKGENFTFTHHSISFELALWQAMALLQTGRASIALAGAADAIEPDLLAVCHDYRWWRESGPALKPMQEPAPRSASIPGEGAAAFVLAPAGSLGERRLATIEGILSRPTPSDHPARLDPEKEAGQIVEFLDRVGYKASDVSLAIVGANGKTQVDDIYERVMEKVSQVADKAVPVSVFKHGCGEFCAAASFAYIHAVEAVHSGKVSDGLRVVSGEPAEVKAVLLYNIYSPGYRSIGLVTR